MATHSFDFQQYVDRQKSPGGGQAVRGGFGDYAFAGDIRVLRRLERLAPVKIVVEATVRFWKTFARSDLLGNSVRVTSRQFPQLHDQVLECARILDITAPTVYVGQSPVPNAGTYGTKEESFIVISSGLIDILNDDQLKFVIGHECGHIHNQHVVYHTAAHYLARGLGIYVKWATLPAGLALNSWSRRGEITCDRAGLICCKDEKAALETVMRLATGSPQLFAEMDIDEFLGQLDDIESGWGRFMELTKTHPYLPKRVKALQLFAASSYFQNVLGEKGGTPLDEVDREVEELVSVM